LTTEQLLDKDNYRIVYAGGSPPVLKISGTISSKSFTDVHVPYKQSLAAGTSYTLQITIKKGLMWAGSNIYWDSATNRLTFAAPGTDANQYYQGVYFCWGSLVGISPVGAFATGTNGNSATGTPIYVPPVSGGPINWTQTNVATAKTAYTYPWNLTPSYGSNGYDNIPYVNNNDGHLGTTAPTYNPGEFKGDICRYLTGQSGIPAGNWVMPTYDDFYTIVTNTNNISGTWAGTATPSSGTYWRKAGGSITWSSKTSDSSAGTYHEWTWGASYCNTATVLPASGYRNTSSGALSNTGYGGNYWSSSTGNTSGAYYLSFYSSGVNTDNAGRGYGFTVRCVLQH
jgi:uncharacterized protein (TIGR02145 family)